jgi:hypothetical protein
LIYCRVLFRIIYILGVQHFYGKGRSPYSTLAAHGKITISGIPNSLIHCVTFTVYTSIRRSLFDQTKPYTYWEIHNGTMSNNIYIYHLQMWPLAAQ